MTVLIFALMCACPVAILRVLTHGVPRWPFHRRRPVTPNPEQERERLSRDLRRLAASHERLTRSDQGARALRVRAIEKAYDETLLRAGAVLELDPPATELDGSSRLQLEADLLVHGLTW